MSMSSVFGAFERSRGFLHHRASRKRYEYVFLLRVQFPIAMRGINRRNVDRGLKLDNYRNDCILSVPRGASIVGGAAEARR